MKKYDNALFIKKYLKHTFLKYESMFSQSTPFPQPGKRSQRSQFPIMTEYQSVERIVLPIINERLTKFERSIGSYLQEKEMAWMGERKELISQISRLGFQNQDLHRRLSFIDGANFHCKIGSEQWSNQQDIEISKLLQRIELIEILFGDDIRQLKNVDSAKVLEFPREKTVSNRLQNLESSKNLPVDSILSKPAPKQQSNIIDSRKASPLKPRKFKPSNSNFPLITSRLSPQPPAMSPMPPKSTPRIKSRQSVTKLNKAVKEVQSKLVNVQGEVGILQNEERKRMIELLALSEQQKQKIYELEENLSQIVDEVAAADNHSTINTRIQDELQKGNQIALQLALQEKIEEFNTTIRQIESLEVSKQEQVDEQTKQLTEQFDDISNQIANQQIDKSKLVHRVSDLESIIESLLAKDKAIEKELNKLQRNFEDTTASVVAATAAFTAAISNQNSSEIIDTEVKERRPSTLLSTQKEINAGSDTGEVNKIDGSAVLLNDLQHQGKTSIVQMPKSSSVASGIESTIPILNKNMSPQELLHNFSLQSHSLQSMIVNAEDCISVCRSQLNQLMDELQQLQSDVDKPAMTNLPHQNQHQQILSKTSTVSYIEVSAKDTNSEHLIEIVTLDDSSVSEKNVISDSLDNLLEGKVLASSTLAEFSLSPAAASATAIPALQHEIKDVKDEVISTTESLETGHLVLELQLLRNEAVSSKQELALLQSQLLELTFNSAASDSQRQDLQSQLLQLQLEYKQQQIASAEEIQTLSTSKAKLESIYEEIKQKFRNDIEEFSERMAQTQCSLSEIMQEKLELSNTLAEEREEWELRLQEALDAKTTVELEKASLQKKHDREVTLCRNQISALEDAMHSLHLTHDDTLKQTLLQKNQLSHQLVLSDVLKSGYEKEKTELLRQLESQMKSMAAKQEQLTILQSMLAMQEQNNSELESNYNSQIKTLTSQLRALGEEKEEVLRSVEVSKKSLSEALYEKSIAVDLLVEEKLELQLKLKEFEENERRREEVERMENEERVPPSFLGHNGVEVSQQFPPVYEEEEERLPAAVEEYSRSKVAEEEEEGAGVRYLTTRTVHESSPEASGGDVDVNCDSQRRPVESTVSAQVQVPVPVRVDTAAAYPPGEQEEDSAPFVTDSGASRDARSQFSTPSPAKRSRFAEEALFGSSRRSSTSSIRSMMSYWTSPIKNRTSYINHTYEGKEELLETNEELLSMLQSFRREELRLRHLEHAKSKAKLDVKMWAAEFESLHGVPPNTADKHAAVDKYLSHYQAGLAYKQLCDQLLGMYNNIKEKHFQLYGTYEGIDFKLSCIQSHSQTGNQDRPQSPFVNTVGSDGVSFRSTQQIASSDVLVSFDESLENRKMDDC